MSSLKKAKAYFSTKSILHLLNITDSVLWNTAANIATVFGVFLTAGSLLFSHIGDNTLEVVLPPELSQFLESVDANNTSNFGDVEIGQFISRVKEKNIPQDDWPDTLQQIAEEYNELKTLVNKANTADLELNNIQIEVDEATKKGDFAKAEILLNEAANISLSKAKEHDEKRIYYSDSVYHYYLTNSQLSLFRLDFKSAKRYMRKALVFIPSDQYKERVEVLNKLTRAELDSHSAEKALDSAQDALDTAEKYLNIDDIHFNISLRNMAEVYMELGKYENADNILNYHIDLFNESDEYIPHHGVFVADIYAYKAAIAKASGFSPQTCLSQAVEALQQYADALKETCGADSAVVGVTLRDLGRIKGLTSDWSDAQEPLQASLEIKQSIYGEDSVELVQPMIDLSKVLIRAGKLQAAESFLKRARNIILNEYGQNHPKIATIFMQMGDLYEQKNRSDLARKAKLNAVSVLESNYGPDDIFVVEALLSLASTLRTVGDFSGADSLNRRAIKILKENLGSNHFRTLKALSTLPSVKGGDEFLKNVKEYLDNLTGFEAKIAETSVDRRIYYGDIKYDKRFGLRLDYSEPRNMSIIASEDGVTYIDRDINQHSFLPRDQFTLGFLLDRDFSLEYLTVTEISESSNEIRADILARDHAVLGTYNLVFQIDPFSLKGWNVTSPGGETVHVLLFDMQRDVAHDPKDFQVQNEMIEDH